MSKKIFKYSKEEGCPFCEHEKKQFTRIHASMNGEVKCDNCGAIFWNVDHDDKDIAASFTGRYAEISKIKLIQNGFYNEQQKRNTIRKNKEKEE